MSNLIVTSPQRPYTFPDKFKAVSNGDVYAGIVDKTDLENPANQIQVYVVGEDGSETPVSQPLKINSGGLLVYNGQPAKFVVKSNYSMLVKQRGKQVMYEPNMGFADPEAVANMVIDAVYEANGGYNTHPKYPGMGLNLGNDPQNIPLGTSLLRINDNGNVIETSIFNDKTFAQNAHTTTSITKNNTGGYTIVTNNGTYESVSQQFAQWRGQSFFYNDFTVDIRGWGAKPSNTAEQNSIAINAALAFLAANGGGGITSSNEKYQYNGATISYPAENINFFGAGWETHWENVADDGSDALLFTGPDFDSPVKGVTIKDMRISGNPQSGAGVKFDKLGRFREDANVTSIYRAKIDGHGNGAGVQYGASTTSGAGNKLVVESCLIDKNKSGIIILGQSNLASINSNTITNHTEDGVSLNQVASTNSVSYNFIADNGRFGVYAFRCEQPIITYNGFNRNDKGAVVLGGDQEGSPSVKYTESALIMGNLFGDNGGGSTSGERTEITVRASRGTMIYCNYFYNTGKDRYVYISDYAEGYMIKSNWFKDFNSSSDDAKKYVVKPGVTNSYGVFDDDIDNTAQWTTYLTNKSLQYIVGRSNTLIQTKTGINANTSYILKGDGTQQFGPGDGPVDVTVGRKATETGAFEVMGLLNVTNTVTLEIMDSHPTARTGRIRVYAMDDGLYYILPNQQKYKITATQV